MIYAIADIHGRLDLLTKAFEYIRKRDPDATIILTGDYIDRGPESAGCVRFLMQEHGSEKVICLKGNHEEMLIDYYNSLSLGTDWLTYGGVQTLVSYGHSLSEPWNPGIIPEHHIAWMDNLPFFHETDHHLFVHAFLSPSKRMADQSNRMMLWGRYPKAHPTFDWSVEGKHVVHGHTPNDEPELLLGRTNLDVGAVWSNKIVIGVFDGPGGPKELIWL